MRLTSLGLVAAMLLGGCQPEVADRSGGPDLVTLYGPIALSDRGAMQPALEPVFASYGLEFDRALGLDRVGLTAFEQVDITVAFPLDGPRHIFSGPRLRDVLSFAGVAGRDIRVTALDGYQREIAAARYQDHGAILAILQDGRPLGLGGRGPAMLVWPRESDPALADMNDDDWVFAVFAIEVIQNVE